MAVINSVVHDFSAHTRSDIYTLDMPKFVYVLTRAESPARVRADKVEKTGSPQNLLKLKLGDEEIGEFKSDAVVGWWIEDEPDEKK
ncbi:MAG TPA: hypothetical protein VKY85_23275 [Candidatus Angelobacter sp.]|nr:hypothetical protein [Candidatus Angelobacter sp.]